jgi:hypothetical protein
VEAPPGRGDVEVSVETRRQCLLSLLLVAALSAACNRSIEPTSDAPAPPLPASAAVHDFESDSPGTVPSGFAPVLAGQGSPGRWAVRQSPDENGPDRNVVAQTGDDDTSNRFPLLIHGGFRARDVDLSVDLRTVSGDEDASGGLVFRYRDKDTFYVVRANALEDNVVAYKMEGGQRDNIGVKGRGDAYGVKVDVPQGRWNTLRVIARGSTFEIFLNARKLFEVEDSTLSGPGQVGLWTKADAVTEFDNLRVQSLDRP